MSNGNGFDDDMGHDEDIGVDLDIDVGGDAAEVESNVQEDREEGDSERTTTSFTKETTAEQSISNYDNFSANDFSFQARNTGRRDANSAVGDYIARVAGVSLDARVGQRRAGDPTSGLSEFDPDLQGETSSSTVSIHTALTGAQQKARQDEATAIRTDWQSPSLVDEWGMTQGIRTAYESPYDASRRALTDTDLARLTEEAGVQGDAVRNSARQWESNEFSRKEIEANRLARVIRIDTENNSKVIKQAEEVLASPVTSETEKTAAATKRYGALSEIRRLEMQQRRIRSAPFYNAVIDPTATVYSKDVHTRVGLEKLNDYIASVANRPLFNTGLTYTKHDPATTMKVQKAIERYDDIYGSWLNDMGKRNSKAINAKGMDMSKGLSGFNMIQGLMNKFGFAYHATVTEKQLRAIKAKWGLAEDEAEGGLPLDEQETRCNEKVGYKWDKETNTCIPISNLNTDYRDYLPD